MTLSEMMLKMIDLPVIVTHDTKTGATFTGRLVRRHDKYPRLWFVLRNGETETEHEYSGWYGESDIQIQDSVVPWGKMRGDGT